MAEDKKKKAPKKRNRFQKGFDEFKSDLNKLRKGKLKPSLQKTKKKTAKKASNSIAKNLTGRGGDPVYKGVKATSPTQKAAKSVAQKITGRSKEDDKNKKTTKKKMGGVVSSRRTKRKR